jgi:alpha-L-rhamnosidase
MLLDRRTFISGASAVVFSEAALPILSAPTAGIAVVDLRTESVVSPLGVETSRPHLSWRMEADRRDVYQSAYRVEVASSAEALAAGRADLWDSGRVGTPNSNGIRYEGALLSSRQRCYWRVRIWDDRNVVSTPSSVSYWEMGLLEASDWSARWLAAEDVTMRDDRATGLLWIRAPASPDDTASQFRLSFSLPTSAEATLFVTAYGKLSFWIDGEAMTLPATAPFIAGPQTAVASEIPLVRGRHIIAVAIGAPDPQLIKDFGFPSGEMAPFLRISLSDGKLLRINSTGWKASTASARDWQTVDFDDQSWVDASPIGEPRTQPWSRQSAMLLRRRFRTSKPVRQARIYATALGAYDLYVNGSRVGDALLTPESTDFRRRLLYRVYDVTSQIVMGENVVGAVVGDGWYASYVLFVGRYPWGAAPRQLLAQLELTYIDDSRDIIGTGTGWQVSRAPIVSSEIYDGEFYDARLEQPDWSVAGFDASRWVTAELGPAPQAALVAQIDPPIRRQGVLTARSITEPKPGVFVFDFGQNFAGWCRLSVRGPEATVVEMRFGELISSNGEIDQSNLRSARASDVYILRGDPGGETFEPHFTYHGFRYVQVTGFSGRPTAGNLEGIVIHSDLTLTGNLRIENPIIQALWRNALWSQRSNFMGIPTDCPQRDERLGWMGDANVFWDAAAFNMDVDSFTRRFMGDIRDAQADDGAFSDFSPAAFRSPSKGNVIGASPGWADAGICLPWTVWQRYGDTGVVDENWVAMTRYVQFIADSNPDYIWRNNRGTDYGDWLALDAKNPGDPTTPKELVATAMWSHSVNCMAQMAEATGRALDARGYRDTWSAISTAFQKIFVTIDGTVGNGSQTSYILALRYDLVPRLLRAAAAANLVADIRRRGMLLSTGFLGTPNSLDVLADNGYNDVVYSLLLRTQFPSWGYMILKGATTIWERWNGDAGDVSMNSFNHYALGAVCGFMFRRIAGIAPLQPGFRKIEVRPMLDPRVKGGGGQYDSVLGRIATRWRQEDNRGFRLDLTVPPNSTAIVYLPATHASRITEGRRSIARIPATKHVTRTNVQAIIEVGSGTYRFAVE